MQSLVNLRDLGGLPVAGGGRTRYGVLYRSDAPHPGDTYPARISPWPPATVVDLRMPHEAERVPYEMIGVERVLHPLHESAAPENIRDGDLAELYRHILEAAADRVASAVAHVVTRPTPSLVHCTAGKDRTGIVIATLLLAAGVPPEEVIGDYVRTSVNMDRVVERIMKYSAEWVGPVNPLWLLTPAEAMSEVVNALTASEHGDAKGWLVAHGAPAAPLDAWVESFVTESH